MKRPVLERYECDSNGVYIVDVSTDRVESLYNDFDKRSPYVRRDLEQEFVEYLIESAQELRKKVFEIRLNFNEPCDSSHLSRIRQSLSNYFSYMADVERQKIRQIFSQSMILLTVGILLLSVSITVNTYLGEDRTVIENVFAEGLIIAAWVSMWEAIAKLLIEWWPHRKNIRLYKKLVQANVILYGVDS